MGAPRHLMTDTPEHGTWRRLKSRCLNPNNPAFSNYGGRGIFVCDRWRNSFENFLADMGRRPSSLHSIDRIDNNGPYSPENCRWATRDQQNKNTRAVIMLSHQGRTMCLSDWARECGVSQSSLAARLNRGVEFERALNKNRIKPKTQGTAHPGAVLVVEGGRTMCIFQWAESKGFSVAAVYQHRSNGKSFDEIERFMSDRNAPFRGVKNGRAVVVDNMCIGEFADSLGVSRGSVYQRRHREKKKREALCMNATTSRT